MSKIIFVGIVLLLALTGILTNVSSNTTWSILINGNFEGQTLDGWNVFGDCTVSDAVACNGSYSAFISDTAWDSRMNQTVYPRTRLPIDLGLILEGWVYPFRTGLIEGEYPASVIRLFFYNESTMEEAFRISYSWCLSVYWQNGTAGPGDLCFLLPMDTEQWNHLLRNVTADAYSYFLGWDFSGVVLYRIEVWYHFSWDSPGAFYVDDLEIYTEISTEIHEVRWHPTCPPPYVASDQVRTNEPVLIEVNATPTVREVLLLFREQGGQWFNVSMTFNDTLTLWGQTIPGFSKGGTVELLVVVRDTYGFSLTSDTYSFDVETLPIGDIDGNGIVNMLDLWMVAMNFGEGHP